MKPNRVITFFAAVLVAGLFTWAFAHEHIGPQEQPAIQAAAP
jgi:hypothetical protein